MTDKLAAMEKKITEAKTGNGFVSAIRKYLAASGNPDFVSDAVKSSHSFSLSTPHLLSILFFYSFVKKEMTEFGSALGEQISKDADFFEKIALAALVSEFKDKKLGATISEGAFEEIEGTDDYYFYALNGLDGVVANTSIEALDREDYAVLSVGDKEYKLSTLKSILEDIQQAKDVFSVEDFTENLVQIARCAYIIDEVELGDEIYQEAISAIQSESDVDVIFYQVGDITVPGNTVFDPAEEVKFPSDSVRQVLIELAQSKLKGEALDGVMDYFS